jgi:nucleoside-diphosphate-sugar epimerase
VDEYTDKTSTSGEENMGNNELHVVIGTGAVGMSVINDLNYRGKNIRAANRRGQANVPDGVEIVQCDAANPDSTRQVCKGATHVYNCVNAPDYHKWPEQFPPLHAGVLEGAAANDARLIVMENLYMYGSHGGKPITEEMTYNGQGPRSTTRIHMTKDLRAAHKSGKVRAVSARASDFFGPHVGDSTVGERVFRAALAGKSAQVLGNPDMLHTYTFISDIGRALVILGEHDEAFGQAWHIPSPPTLTTREFISEIFKIAGSKPKISTVPKFAIRPLALFMPALKGIDELAHQFTEPFIMDHGKFEAAFGNHATPLEGAIRMTVQWYRENPQIK